jgi:hypothetical protein
VALEGNSKINENAYGNLLRVLFIDLNQIFR